MTACSWCIDEGKHAVRADAIVYGLALCFSHEIAMRSDIDRLERMGADDPEAAHGAADAVLLKWAPRHLRDAVTSLLDRQPWVAGA